MSQIYDLAQSLETKIIEQNTIDKTWKHRTKNGNKIQKREEHSRAHYAAGQACPDRDFLTASSHPMGTSLAVSNEKREQQE